MTLTEQAPAKINLALHVRHRRADGYHALETIFAFCADGDLIEAEPADTLSLAVTGPFAGGLADEADNLVLRAARALASIGGVKAGAQLRLVKNLPIASGLGGGSADAAAALRLLDRLWGTGFGLARLADIARSLGADVPACVWSRPMRGEGVGEELAPVDLPSMPVLLVNPGVAVATGPVFRAWDGIDRGPLGAGDAMAAALSGRNDLEQPAVSLAPVIGDVLAALSKDDPPILVRMSGSGATCFALYRHDAARDRACLRIGAAQPDWWLLPTRLRAV